MVITIILTQKKKKKKGYSEALTEQDVLKSTNGEACFTKATFALF